ncbi:hypothetical protein AVEN_54827-1 [Araneus ventricosus]|uniref:Mos1 transposase HTH domain-containing protein n=1 Tax=Araneus ventricosus TaxID=182803 RepID=A0A4Y2EZI9_ARAVE|nr:hypothetical protein AVEN_54827-1 [Araneus ventricosus]
MSHARRPVSPPDLNPCDLFLWGHLKDTVYRKNPTTIADLVQPVCDKCELILIKTLEVIAANFVLRLGHVVAEDGEHFENIVTLGKSADQSHAMLQQVYGDDTVTLKTLYTWFKKLIGGHEDEHGSGRSITADNTRRHSTAKRFLPQRGVTELSHPSPYSPDLSLPHFFPFPKHKVVLKGRRFTEIMDIEAAVTRDLKAVPVKEF